MSIRRFHRGLTAKWAALVLSLLLFYGNLAPSSQAAAAGQEERDLEGPFKWATGDYQAGKYYDAQRNLELLLSYYGENEAVLSPKEKRLKGKIHLLLGATYEKLRSLEKARQQYRMAKDLLAYPHIENIDLAGMPFYSEVFTQTRQPPARNIIMRPKKERKKKRISPLLIIAGVAVVGAAAFFLLKKKKGENITVEPDFDTRVLGIQWVHVDAGEFMMGNNSSDANNDEIPVHPVYLIHYRISRYEITFDQYDLFCEITARSKPHDSNWGRGSRPVINVTWTDANAFCTWLSEKTGKYIHLPSEAQWEIAAKGTDQRRYPWGSQTPTFDQANFDGHHGQTLPVGSLPGGVSPYGVHDMAGNAAEWCWDQYDPHYYAQSPYNSPVNLPAANYKGYLKRVVRGGSWNDILRDILASNRDSGGSYQGIYTGGVPVHDNETGFRIVLEN